MPTLFRLFSVFLAAVLLCGLAMVGLATLVRPYTRHISVEIPADRLVGQPAAAVPAPAAVTAQP